MMFNTGKWDTQLGHKWDDDKTYLEFDRYLNERTTIGVEFSESPDDQRVILRVGYVW